MNEKHLLWHIFGFLDEAIIEEMIDQFSDVVTPRYFSDIPQHGEITVGIALHERYDAYKKAKQND